MPHCQSPDLSEGWPFSTASPFSISGPPTLKPPGSSLALPPPLFLMSSPSLHSKTHPVSPSWIQGPDRPRLQSPSPGFPVPPTILQVPHLRLRQAERCCFHCCTNAPSWPMSSLYSAFLGPGATLTLGEAGLGWADWPGHSHPPLCCQVVAVATNKKHCFPEFLAIDSFVLPPSRV